VAQEYREALEAGVVPAWLRLPGGLVGSQRVVRISVEAIRHIAARHPERLIFSLQHMPEVLADPTNLGYRIQGDPHRVGFVRGVGYGNLLVLIAVKFLDRRNGAWVSTAHRLGPRYLTRRLRAGTMFKVSRGP
jgi:hypothetical protein